jgi:hypothetical protein
VPLSEESFRALLDEDGLLREPAPFRAVEQLEAGSYLVFAQAKDARIDAARWRDQAARFFGAKLGLTTEKRYRGEAPEVDAARVVVASDEGNGTRLVYGRPRAPQDLGRAEAAEAKAGGGGLADLAARCDQTWLVEAEGEGDRVSLLLAAILASVCLGPIVSPSGEIFGVRTARAKLEALRNR